VALSLLASARQPVEPVKPEGYVPSVELEAKLAEVQAHEAERQKLLGLAEPVKPMPPVAPDFTDVAELEEHEAQRQSALRDQARFRASCVACRPQR
jgi:hypothetical protein